MVDWFLAEKLASFVSGQGEEHPHPAVDLAGMAADSEKRVVAYTGLEPQRPLPPPEGVDRSEWVRTNLHGMRGMLDPVLAKAATRTGPLKPFARVAAGGLLTLEVGVILGFVAQRVLGQYELVLLEPAEERAPRLLFVMPNLGGAVKSFGVPEEEFVRWVALHEVTHAVQFAGVPWLQGHLGGLLRELLSRAELRVDAKRALRLPGAGDLRRLVEAVRGGDIVSLVARPEERELLDRVQTTMAVVEGHAEHVMDAVGQEVLPSLGELREALETRRSQSSGAARILTKVLGLEMKLKQYKMGKAFCDAVVAKGGIERLNHVWTSPEALPTSDELEHPERWLERTSVPKSVTAPS